MTDFDAYLAERVAAVDEYLDTHLPSEQTQPQSIHRAMRYSLFAGGKRLRPLLAFAAAEAVGGSKDQVLAAAAALELIHTYSLIHDDLPAMDDDSLRRGKPSSHVAFGEAIAILAGDALLTEAFSRIAAAPVAGPEAAHRRLRAVSILADAAGVRGMVGGQVADIESEGRSVGKTTLDYIHRHKTGALIKAATRVGGLLGGGNGEQIERLARYGEHIGLAFQIVDDILDVEGDPSALGKSAGKDQRAGKATYPGLYGLERARHKAGELSEQAIELAASFGAPGEPLAYLARRIVERSS